MIDLEHLITQAGIKDVATLVALRAVANEVKELRQVTSKMKYFTPPTMPEGIVLGTSLGIGTDPPTQTTKQYLKDQDYGLDVKEFIQGRPAVGKWYMSGTGAAGIYVWDTEVFNESLFYTRQVGNTQIKFNKSGRYLIVGQATVSTLGAGVTFTIVLVKNGVIVRQFVANVDPAGAGTAPVLDMLDITHEDYISVQNSVGVRQGDADGLNCFLSIYHLN